MDIPKYMIVGCMVCGDKMNPTPPCLLNDEKYIEDNF